MLYAHNTSEHGESSKMWGGGWSVVDTFSGAISGSSKHVNLLMLFEDVSAGESFAMPRLIEDFFCQLLPQHLKPNVLSLFRIAFRT